MSLPAAERQALSRHLATRPRSVPRGAVRRLWHLSPAQREVMVAGPAETGKTFGALSWLHETLLASPRAQAVMLRVAYAYCLTSCVQTYEFKILRSADGVRRFGGERPQWYDYPNGARLWIGGLDKPQRVLSSERDLIYVNQAEELGAAHWEYLLTRATGRAGNLPYARVLGDCNPGPPDHWIQRRRAAGRLLQLDSRHEDNPTLYDDEGRLTAQGRVTLAVLDGLTGIQYQRLRQGLWVSAEGTVYELLPRHRGTDLYRPGTPTQLAVDPSNGSGPYAALVIQQVGARVLIVDEFYRVGGLDEDLHDWLVATPYYETLTDVICDPAKPDTIARLRRLLGVRVRAKTGRKDITAQIAAVKSLLQPDPVSGEAALCVDAGRCPMLLDEFATYAWRRPGAANPDRNRSEEPEDAHNHCLDALAYWVTTKALTGLGRRRPVFAPPSVELPGIMGRSR